MQDAVVRFFDDNEIWLTRVLTRGRDTGTLEFTGTPTETARMIVSSLEGAMLVARPFGDIERFEQVANRLLANLCSAGPHHAGEAR
jgi:TetR/AcrR family transcriptional repressor of nem operon